MKSAFNAPHLCNEDAAIAYVEAQLWPDGPICPHCGTIGEATKLKGKSTRPGLWKCRMCRKPFTVRMRSIFESSHVPMHIWLQAIYLICSSKKGISTRQIQRTIGGSLKTAWFLMHRIRHAMDESRSGGPLGGEGQIVESDETYTVHKEGGPTWILHPQHGWQKQRSGADRVPVVTLVERGGRVRSRKVENVTAATLRTVVFDTADTKSRLMTEELRAYRGIGRRFAGHDAVNHSEEEWARKLDDGVKATVNSVEGFFSILKRGIYGCYFHVSEQHLHRYLAEFDFRYSNRSAIGVEDGERTDRAIKGAKGKRLTYETTRGGRASEEKIPF
jgi:transposase-like protein